MKKKNTSYNLQIDTLAMSLKGVLLLFIDLVKCKPYSGVNNVFHNPMIEKTAITIEGEPNEFYSQ